MPVVHGAGAGRAEGADAVKPVADRVPCTEPRWLRVCEFPTPPAPQPPPAREPSPRPIRRPLPMMAAMLLATALAGTAGIPEPTPR